MLTRLYVNNHRCLVNFEWKPGPLALLMGPNGAGKSTLLRCLDLLRTFVAGEGKTDVLFVESDLTRWAAEKVQSFEAEVNGNGGTYLYKLQVEVNLGHDRSFIREETLLMDRKYLFQMKTGDNMFCEAQLYRDDFGLGPKYPFDWSRSGLAALQARPENTKLTWFRNFMSRLLVVKINPFAMESESDAETAWPSFAMANFTSWYRFLSQEEQGKLLDLFGTLREVLNGFRNLNLRKTGEKRRALKAEFCGAGKGNDIEYDLGELSDGQRVLIVLYTLLELCVTTGATVCIDEPDNFVATREIQPWLAALKDRCLEGAGQALLVSHHPEIVDYIGATYGFWMEREPNAHSRLHALDEKGSNLKLSELIARGWINE